MDIKGAGPKPPQTTGISREHFTRPIDCLMGKLFIKHFVLEEILILLLHKMLSGKFTPYFSEEAANRLFSDKLALMHPYYKPAAMVEMDQWRQVVNTIATSLCSNAESIKSSREPRLSRSDLNSAQQEIIMSTESLKVIEDWFYYHQASLRNLIKPGLIPKIVDLKRSLIITNILVIDDDQKMLQNCEVYFSERLGLDVVSVNPKDPCAYVQQLVESREIYAYDMIILDGDLPGTSGAKLIKMIKEKVPDFSGYIVANSGFYREQEEMLKAGADLQTPLPKVITALSQFFFEI